MYNKAPLFIYVEGNDLPEDARNTLSSTEIPFTLLNNLEETFKTISLDNSYALIVTHSTFLCEEVTKAIYSYGCDTSRFFVLFNPKTTHSAGFFNNLDTSSETLEQFLTRLIKHNLVDLNPIKNDLLPRLVREELEKIGVLKKYTAFKFLADLICLALTVHRYQDVYTPNVFKKISILNLVDADIVERDVRHMLMQCWKKSEALQYITTMYGDTLTPNARNILDCIILHLHSNLQ